MDGFNTNGISERDMVQKNYRGHVERFNNGINDNIDENSDDQFSNDKIENFKILVVEDNHVNQVLMGAYLEQFGFEKDLVSSAEEAFDYLDNNKCDLILMDIQLPNIDGVEAMKTIHTRADGKAKLTIIALTANAMRGDKEKYLSDGFDDYISKPIDSKELYDKLHHYYNKKK